jgi:hypothetical protein
MMILGFAGLVSLPITGTIFAVNSVGGWKPLEFWQWQRRS